MKFLSDVLAKAGLTVDGVVTLNNTATGQTPNANDNSTKLATTAWVRTFVQPYSLPIASASVLGGIKVGNGLSIDAITGVLTASGGGISTFRDKEIFTTTAGQTTFTLQNTYTPGLLDVFVNGVYLNDDNYTASNGSTVVLDDATALNDIVTFFIYSPYYVGETPNARSTCAFTATSGQTTFSCSYAVGSVDVFYNGSKLASSEFTAINGTSIVLATACVVGDYVEIVSWLAGGGISSSRTITINGVTYDLTANRTWSALPVGGTAGQLLAKVDGTDYNAQWIDEAPASSYTSQLKHRVKAGVAINKGQAVYVTSADGTNMIVGKASNASEQTSSKTMGLLESTVSTNGFANVITEGLLTGLNTTGATAAGDPVWLGTDGNLIYGLVNKPYAPAHLVFIGVVTRRNANNGEIFVKVQNGFEMKELHDYVENGVQNNFVISYESSTTLYKPKSIATLLGYTPANAARSLTINGTSYDLTADRTWTLTSSNIAEGTNLYYTDTRVGTYLTANSYNSGTGTTNYLPKFTGSTTIGNSALFDGGGFGGFNNTGVGSRTFVVNAASGRPLAIEAVEFANVHSISIRPNNTGFNVISSNYISGGTFLPLSLSGRENSSDLVLQTSGNVSIGTTTDNGARLQVTGSATFSSSVTTTGGFLQFPNNYGVEGRNAANTAHRTVLKLNTSNQIEIGRDTDISSIILGTASAVNALTIASTGAATFSSTIRSDATNGFSIGSVAGHRRIQYVSANTTFSLLNDSNALANLEAAAATFSSSVTASGLNAIGSTLNNGNALRFYRAGLTEMAYIGWSNENTNNSTWLFKSSNGNPIAFSPDGTNQQVIFNIDGSAFFNYPILGSRSFVFRTVSGRPLTLETIALTGIHSLYLRPNDSGRHLISSNYLSGGVYLPLALSARENDSDLVLATNGNVGIGASSLLERLGVNGNIHVEGVGNSIYFDTDGNGRTIQQYVTNQFQFHIVNARGNSARFILGNASISLGTSSTPQFNINTTNGNIGIGTVSDNGRKLNVNGSGLFSGTLSTAKVEVGAVESVNITTNSTFTLVSSSYLNIRTNILVSVTIRWNNNANAQRQYLLFIGATDTGWGTPNSAIFVIASNDWSSGYVGAATFSIGGSGSLRTLNISVANAATYNVTANASIIDM